MKPTAVKRPVSGISIDGMRRPSMLVLLRWLLIAALLVLATCQTATTQEDPYFVTDHHHLPDAGALGLANYSVLGAPGQGNGFLGSQMEFEYRMTKWWSTQVQLDGQTTFHDSTVFTGYSWTNKFKLAPTIIGLTLRFPSDGKMPMLLTSASRKLKAMARKKILLFRTMRQGAFMSMRSKTN